LVPPLRRNSTFYKPSAILEDEFLPSAYLIEDSADPLSAGTRHIPFESHKPLGPPVLQSTSDLNEAGPRFNTQAKTTAMTTNVLNIVNLTTEKERSAKKSRKRHEARHTTLESKFKRTMGLRETED
jgi:hypothetical protein